MHIIPHNYSIKSLSNNGGLNSTLIENEYKIAGIREVHFLKKAANSA